MFMFVCEKDLLCCGLCVRACVRACVHAFVRASSLSSPHSPLLAILTLFVMLYFIHSLSPSSRFPDSPLSPLFTQGPSSLT